MKKLFLLFFAAVMCLSIVYAAPTCTMNTLYQYPSSEPSLEVKPAIACVSPNTPITTLSLSCDGSQIDYNEYLGSNTYTFGDFTPTITLAQNQTRICELSLYSDEGIYTNSFVLQYMFTSYSPTFATNSCPTDTSQVILYLGLLFFFLAVIVICLVQRSGLIGIFASIAIICYSLFVTGCYPVFGMLFFGIGIGFFMYFFFGRY